MGKQHLSRDDRIFMRGKLQGTRENMDKTRQSVFLEQWPDTQLDKEGNVIICPKQICKGEEFNKLMAACRGTNCYKCRREFWQKVVG